MGTPGWAALEEGVLGVSRPLGENWGPKPRLSLALLAVVMLRLPS